MTTWRLFVFAWVTVLWLALAPAVSACPLCYGGDDAATGRATLWAAVILVAAVYGLLATGAWWVVRRLRRFRSRAGGEP